MKRIRYKSQEIDIPNSFTDCSSIRAIDKQCTKARRCCRVAERGVCAASMSVVRRCAEFGYNASQFRAVRRRKRRAPFLLGCLALAAILLLPLSSGAAGMLIADGGLGGVLEIKEHN